MIPELLLQAPPVDPWPTDLPEAETYAGGIYLPNLLALEVQKKMMAFDHYPRQCQIRLDTLGELARANYTIDWRLLTSFGVGGIGLGIILGVVLNK